MKFYCMLAGAAMAQNILEIPLFEEADFGANQAQVIPGLVGESLIEVTDGDDKGNVTFKPCDQDIDSFVMDDSNTRAIPNPIGKNMDVKLHLEGLL